MLPHFTMFAHYNRWANRRLYAAAGALAQPDFRADRGAFFGSVCGTLNHLLVTDRIWMARFGIDPMPPYRLDTILFEDLAPLRSARQAEDERLVGWIESLDAAAIGATITYRTLSSPADVTQPLRSALAHLFNHQTHHRGQVHGLLTAIAGRDAAPALDLILFQRETGMGLT